MSKAFTKDDDGAERVLVRPRPPLPPDTPNYVTPRGISLLRDELESLGRERSRLEAASRAGGPESTALAARVAELAARIASANVIDPSRETHDKVRFGATVTVQTEAGASRRYQIVGVDEADAATGCIAFTAPLARSLLGASIGDTVVVRLPRGSESVIVVAIE
jgi:transcription elongation factor GreB